LWVAVRRGLAVSTLTVFVLTLVSSALGYFRESGVAAIFGASADTDAYLVAFFIPNAIFLILVSGTLSQAFVPVFVEYLATDRREEAWHVGSSVLNLLAPLLLALAAAAALGAPLVVRALAPGLDPEVARSAEGLTRVLMPIMLFLSLSAVVTALLNSLGEFTVPALSPVVGALLVIASLFTLGRWMGIYGLGLGTLASSAVRLLMQLPWLIRSGFRYSFAFDFRHPGVRRIALLCGPVVASAVGSLRDDVRPGKDGILVPPGDEAALAKGIVKLLSDQGRAERMGASGRRRTEKERSWESCARATAEVYRRVLGRRHGQPGQARRMGRPTAGILRQRWATGSDKSGSDPAASPSERYPLGGSGRSPGGGGTERKAMRFRTNRITAEGADSG